MINVDDFRAYVTEVLRRRQELNPAYTISSFARDLSVSPQKLGQIINGKCGLSPQAAEQMAGALELNAEDAEFFKLLVASKHARNGWQRAEAQLRVKELRSQQKLPPVSPRNTDWSDAWVHWAALLLIETENFKPDLDWLAKKLDVSVGQAIQTYEELFRQNYLKRDDQGNWVRGERSVAAGDRAKVVRREIVEQHKLRSYALQNAALASDRFPKAERHTALAGLPIRSEDLSKITARIDAFLVSLFEEFYEGQSDFDRCYAFVIEAFPFDRTISDSDDETAPSSEAFSI